MDEEKNRNRPAPEGWQEVDLTDWKPEEDDLPIPEPDPAPAPEPPAPAEEAPPPVPEGWQEVDLSAWKPEPDPDPPPPEPEEITVPEEPEDFFPPDLEWDNLDYHETLSEYDEDFELDSTEKGPGPIRRDTSRRTGCVGGVLYFLFVTAVSVLLAIFGWLAAVDVLAIGKPDTAVEVTVPETFTVQDIASLLRNRGLIRYKSLFSLYGKYSHADTKIQPGTYILNTNYDYRALVNGMTHRRGVRTEVTVTIPEGYTMAQIFKLLEEKGVCTQDELWTTAAEHDFDYSFLAELPLGSRTRLEGYLFPDTYQFYVGDDAERALNKLLSNFNSKFRGKMADRANELGLTVQEVVTIASMIEKEAAGDFERSRIAAVIFNRLADPENYPFLEIDATIYYAASLDGGEFSLEYDSPYNSYTHPGLIPGPIANPGEASLEAALYPDATDEYYYALAVNGRHRFFHDVETFREFLASEEYAYHKTGEDAEPSEE